MDIECSLCQSVVDHGEIFYQEELHGWHGKVYPELFVCPMCAEDRLLKLKEATPAEIYRLLRLCHPNEQGEPYWRHEILEEFRGRPNQIFDALHCPLNKEAIYKNRYTGHEQSLEEMWGGHGSWQSQREGRNGFDDWFPGQSVFVMENWLPIEIWNDIDAFPEYKVNTPSKLTGYMEEDKCKGYLDKHVEKVKLGKNDSLKNWS